MLLAREFVAAASQAVSVSAARKSNLWISAKIRADFAGNASAGKSDLSELILEHVFLFVCISMLSFYVFVLFCFVCWSRSFFRQAFFLFFFRLLLR